MHRFANLLPACALAAWISGGAWLLGAASAQAPALHQTIDRLVSEGLRGATAAPRSEDAEFIRRIYLDLIGRIPTADECRAFAAAAEPDKRAQLIERLLISSESSEHLADVCHVMLMERRGESKEWRAFLTRSMAANKPWNQLVRELLYPDPKNEDQRGAEFYITKRLEHEGQNAIDYPGLTRDVGRLFLGVDLQCCQCHDHLTVDEYKQVDFQGLFYVLQNVTVLGNRLIEKPMTKKLEFSSVFDATKKGTGPRIPLGKEFEIPALAAGEEYEVKPDPPKQEPGVLKFSPLKKLSEELPAAENRLFARNAANRLWFFMLGRGIVHPLDLQHASNGPSHPALLDALTDDLIAHRFDLRYLLREIALSETYQRTSRVSGTAPPPERFAVGLEKRLSAEQLLRSVLRASGQWSIVAALPDATAQLDGHRARFITALANPAGQPELEFAPSLKAALFLLNEKLVLGWLPPQPGNLVDRLSKFDELDKLAEELYLSVLARLPSAEERAEVASYLVANPNRCPAALVDLTWALLACTEFCVNH